MTKFEAISLGVALVALIQPWIAVAWKRWAKRGRIEVYETGRIELGFGNFGVTIGLHGALRAVKEDVFVQSMNVEVVREADNATQRLEWAAFRSHQLSASSQAAPTIELPHCFNVHEMEPRRYNVVFRSPTLERELQSLLGGVSDAWFGSPVNQERREVLAAQGNLGPEFAQRVTAAFENFRSEQIFSDTYARLSRLCYQEPGSYKLILRIGASGKAREFVKQWHFDVHPDEARRLRLNVIVMLNLACGEGAGWSYHFVYPEYQQKQKVGGNLA